MSQDLSTITNALHQAHTHHLTTGASSSSDSSFAKLIGHASSGSASSGTSTASSSSSASATASASASDGLSSLLSGLTHVLGLLQGGTA